MGNNQVLSEVRHVRSECTTSLSQFVFSKWVPQRYRRARHLARGGAAGRRVGWRLRWEQTLKWRMACSPRPSWTGSGPRRDGRRTSLRLAGRRRGRLGCGGGRRGGPRGRFARVKPGTAVCQGPRGRLAEGSQAPRAGGGPRAHACVRGVCVVVASRREGSRVERGEASASVRAATGRRCRMWAGAAPGETAPAAAAAPRGSQTRADPPRAHRGRTLTGSRR